MNDKRSALTLYLQEIGRYPLLTPEQELELGRRIKENNDSEAREMLINSNLRLVVAIAKPFKNQNTSLEDLISEGNLGLITAADKYDYTMGYRFSTCAVPWIKQAIMKSIIDKSRTIRIPAHIVQLFNKEKKAMQELYEAGLDKEPTKEDIAKKMGVSVDELDEIRTWKLNTVSLDTPIGDAEEDTLGDLYGDEREESPVNYADKISRRAFVDNVINGLDDRTQRIFKLRFGLGVDGDPEEYFEEHTLEEIGDLLTPKITRERTRQIICQQLTKWKVRFGDKFKF